MIFETRITLILAVQLIWFALPGQVRAAIPENALDKGMGGHVVASVGGRKIFLPSLKTEITGDIQGDLSVITVRQTFANPTGVAINATYLFPLNKDAAVHAMQMQVGDELVTAKIEKRQAARQTFEQAKQQGKSAALLEQHRPNMFTQEIANLMPGRPVTIVIKYSQVVPRVDAAYELRVPLVVGPRYIPRGGAKPQLVRDGPIANDNRPEYEHEGQGAGAAMGQQHGAPSPVHSLGQWNFGPVPNYPEVSGLTIPTIVDKERVSITINLISGIRIGNVTGATHALDVSGTEGTRTIKLAGGKTIDNRDFVLRYELAAARPQAGLLIDKGADDNTFSLLIEPPKAPSEGQITAREMVFVLDASGSMSGAPITASKTFMRHALATLRPRDFFRIVRFSSTASEFGNGPAPATPANIAAGTQYVERISADGGTEMLTGLKQAYAAPPPVNTLRIVVFLSDGYIGNEGDILAMVARSVGRGRLYAFGVGSSVNRYLIAEMARLGRGMSRIIDPTADGNAEAVKFASSLKTPVLTDIKINWGTLSPKDVSPAIIPGLFEGDSIRVQGRFASSTTHRIEISGKVNGRPVAMPLEIDGSQPASAGSRAIPYIWARSRVADHMREIVVPVRFRHSGLSNERLEAEVTALGLSHSIVTQWTSFVAVSQQIVNVDPASAIAADVPLPMVKGVGPSAYPKGQQAHAPQPLRAIKRVQHTRYTPPSNRHISGIRFSGGSTPEPEQIFGMLLLIITVGGTLIRRSSRNRT